MGAVRFIKQLICDDENNVTPNTLFSGFIATAIVGTIVYSFFYLPYALIFYGDKEANGFIIIMATLGLVAWCGFIVIGIENIKRFFAKYGNKKLFTWR